MLRMRTALGITLGCAVCVGAAPAPAARDVGNPSTAEIIKRSVEVNTADWKAQPLYEHQELDLKSKADAAGTAHAQQSKTYEVLMIDGSPYLRLIGVDNEPLRGLQAAQEEAKLKREMARRASESPSDRSARVAKYQSGRAEEHLLMQQMVDAFDFKLIGEQRLEGIDCYVLDAYPRPGYQPPVERARVLTGMHGRLWIDKAGYHWVKVQAEVTSPVEFGLFLAQVKPGTKFELDQAPVGNVWLPKCFTESVNASVFGLIGYRTNDEEHYSDYRLAQPMASSRTSAP